MLLLIVNLLTILINNLWRCFGTLEMIEYPKWPRIHVINFSSGICCETRRKLSPVPDFFVNGISYPVLDFSGVSQGQDNSRSNEYETNSGIQNKTAKRSISMPQSVFPPPGWLTFTLFFEV